MMLTYSYSPNGLITISSLKKIASAQLAKSFWNLSFSFLNKRPFGEESWKTELKDLRKVAISNLNIYAEKKNIPPRIKHILKESIFLFSRAYCEMMLWRSRFELDMDRHMIITGELYCPKYFSVEGEFDDLTFVKYYIVQNSRYQLKTRFKFACLYCLENESQTLWEEIIGLNLGRVWCYMENTPTLIGVRISQLKGKSHFQNREVNEVGFEIASIDGHISALYYFWQKMSDPQRISLTENDRYFELKKSLNYDKIPYDKVICFLYSQLSMERKKDLLDWTVKHGKIQTWFALISSYAEAMHSEILDFVFQLPFPMYSELLHLLANRIRLLEIPSDIEIFHTLWNNISPEDRRRKEFIEGGILVLSHLVEVQQFQNVDDIIKQLSLTREEEYILTVLNWSYHNCIIFSKEGEFYLFEKYLVFSLELLAISFQSKVSLPLKNIINSSWFRRWLDETSKTKSNKIKIDFVFFK